MKKVDNEAKLRPLVEGAVKSLYGQAVKNINILGAERIPLFREPKKIWLVNVDFKDNKYEYSIQVDVQIADGRITRAHELHRVPLKE